MSAQAEDQNQQRASGGSAVPRLSSTSRCPSRTGMAWLHRHCLLILLIALAVVRGVLYAVVIPPWQAPDEPGHFEYVWMLAHLSRLPAYWERSPALEQDLIGSLYRWQWGVYAGRPLPEVPPLHLSEMPPSLAERRPLAVGRLSLAYIYQVPFLAPLQAYSVEAQLYAVRLSSVLLQTAIVALAYLTYRELCQRDASVLLLASAMVLLSPQHTFVNASAGDGPMAELFACLVTYGWARAFRRSAVGPLEVLAIAGGTVLALFAKKTAVYLLPVDLALTVWWAARRMRRGASWREMAWPAAMMLLLVLGSALWWKGPLGLSVSLFVKEPRAGGVLWVDRNGVSLGRALLLTHDSLWASLGWMSLAIGERWYGALAMASLLGLSGWLVRGPRPTSQHGSWELTVALLFVTAALAVHISANLLGHAEWGYNFQGRYLFPVLVPWAYLLATGWTCLTGGRRGATALLVAALAILDAWTMAMYVVPHYYGG